MPAIMSGCWLLFQSLEPVSFWCPLTKRVVASTGPSKAKLHSCVESLLKDLQPSQWSANTSPISVELIRLITDWFEQGTGAVFQFVLVSQTRESNECTQRGRSRYTNTNFSPGCIVKSNPIFILFLGFSVVWRTNRHGSTILLLLPWCQSTDGCI